MATITPTKIATTMTNKRKRTLLSVGLLVVIIIVIIIALSLRVKTAVKTTPTAGLAEPAPDASISVSNPELQDAGIASLKGAKVVVAGANPITPDNKVVTPTGQVTDNASRPMDPAAPRQTGFLKKEDLPTTLIKISVGNGRFSPKEFTTVAGAPTSFSLTGVDNVSHLIAFDDPALAAVIILVGPGQTKAITFNAPEKPGEYTFRCDAPGHLAQGESGKMIVK